MWPWPARRGGPRTHWKPALWPKIKTTPSTSFVLQVAPNLVQYVFGLTDNDMRIARRFIVLLAVVALLAPGIRWASLGLNADACACPPASCMCVGHHHGMGSCCMGKGGHCGLGSQDEYLNSLLSMSVYLPTMHSCSNPDLPWSFGSSPAIFSVLPSHARIPELPPRIQH
jgi:hypothetical protein